ncbi:hypothetical protein CKO31_23355 [Thiohalocapsa halophila]|uniref:PEP-CTERM sorting domain-containing protein n=1 Tax=Thiohalocapsa halophila TaxID=69359 RepID=A0ABS1CPL1_9GAMM|nr:NF038130 family PEP-CTERM protein [Thiohalocapsa halophila]MBK1633628.1 hypothetical protein [Thiohalocapsa halophila]
MTGKRVSAVSVVALVAASALWAEVASASVVTISNVSITGTYDVWEADVSGVLTNSGQLTPPPPLETYLSGSAANPGDNIELGNGRAYTDWQSGVRTTLTGDLGTAYAVDLVTPTLADWGNILTLQPSALAYDYVNAALASIGKSSADWDENALVGIGVGPVTFEQAVQAFVFGEGLNPTTSGALAVSDPNPGYVLLEDAGSKSAVVRVGLQGNFDASVIVEPLLPFVGYDPQTDPFPPQASEVVRLDLYGAGNELLSSDFKFAFSATRTGQAPEDPDCFPNGGLPDDRCSYTGNYEVTQQVPVPTTLALLTIALGGLAGVRQGCKPGQRHR